MYYADNLYEAYTAWDDYVLKNKILDPFKALRSLQEEYTEYIPLENGGTKIIRHDMSEEQINRQKQLERYRDEFISQREIFIGQFYLKNYGYNELSYLAQAHRSSDAKFQEWFRNVKPCDGKECQCSLFCPYFFTVCNK